MEKIWANSGDSHFLEPDDLWSLLPEGLFLENSFTTRELAAFLLRPLAFAQRVAYCLRLSGAVETVGKTGNRRVYRRADAVALPVPVGRSAVRDEK